MRKTGRYYCSIVSANLMALLVGCSYHSKNNRMDTPPLEEQSVVAQASTSKPLSLVDVSQKLNSLLETLKQGFAYIAPHINEYTLNEITRLDGDFHRKQVEDNPQKHPLMEYNKICSVDATRISKDKMAQIQNFRVSSSTLPMLCYLKHWQVEASERFKVLKSKLKVLQGKIAISAICENTQRYISRKCSCCRKGKKQICYDANLSNDGIATFVSAFSEYLYLDLLPYWRKIVEFLLFHAFNTSVAQGKIDCVAAKKKYEAVCQAIEAIYSVEHIQACHNDFVAELENAKKYSVSSHHYNPVKIIEKLEENTLEPIQKIYTNHLNKLIDEIDYTDESKLKEKVSSSLKLFYNIAYSLGIIDLISGFVSLISIYGSSIEGSQAEENLLKKIGTEGIQFVTAQVDFVDFIVGNGITLDQVNSKAKELIDDVNNLLHQNKNNNSCHVRSNVGRA